MQWHMRSSHSHGMLGASEGNYVLFFSEGHRIYIEAGRLIPKSKK